MLINAEGEDFSLYKKDPASSTKILPLPKDDDNRVSGVAALGEEHLFAKTKNETICKWNFNDKDSMKQITHQGRIN